MPITVRLPFWSENQPVRVSQFPGEGGHRSHTFQAWDFALGITHRVRAIADGVVMDTRETVPDGDASQLSVDKSWGSGATGNLVTLKHQIGGQTFYSSYFHLRENKVPVEIGDTVSAGQEIGQVGHTGLRSGGHIHMQVSTSLIWFGATSYGWDTATDNGAAQLVADASNENAVALRFEGFGTTLPGYVIGPPEIVFTEGPDVMKLATPGRYNTGSGDDVVTGSSRRDIVHAQQGNDQVIGKGGQDKLFGGQGADVLKGGAGRDHLKGGNGRDRLKGGSGDDRVEGGGGNDHLNGGTGTDTFVLNSHSGQDWITDFQDDVDNLSLSTRLWDNQDLTPAEVIDRFATQDSEHVWFDFDTGTFLGLRNTALNTLADDILLVY